MRFGVRLFSIVCVLLFAAMVAFALRTQLTPTSEICGKPARISFVNKLVNVTLAARPSKPCQTFPNLGTAGGVLCVNQGGHCITSAGHSGKCVAGMDGTGALICSCVPTGH